MAPAVATGENRTPLPPLVVVLGPTASGKTGLAVELALSFGGEVLNFDSRQVYRRLDIGTAKPTRHEMRGIAHHLFDLVEPEEVFSAACFRRLAIEAALTIGARGKLPLLVGGTGLYLRAFLEGLFEGPERDPTTHGRLESIASDPRGQARLYRWLLRVDPGWAKRIGPGDRQRILRGLDVYLGSGQPLSRQIAERAPAQVRAPFRVLKLGLSVPRAELSARIDRRVEQMWNRGLVEEVLGLMARPGFTASNAAKALGYRDVARYLGGTMDRAEAVERMQRDTRRLAKRQQTWFRREREVRWIAAGEGGVPVAEAGDEVRRFLSTGWSRAVA